MTLLRRRRLVGVQHLLDDVDMLSELRATHRDRPLVPGRHRMLHHLRDRPAVDPNRRAASRWLTPSRITMRRTRP
jgi:hypothetical protein